MNLSNDNCLYHSRTEHDSFYNGKKIYDLYKDIDIAIRPVIEYDIEDLKYIEGIGSKDNPFLLNINES